MKNSLRRTREEYEDLENKILAVYAMKSQDSKGRVHDNELHAWRTSYQRDRDRIVHSEAFRKLEYKTQVFAIFEGDYYRTRLTHTIEVAQIARTIGRSLKVNEDLIEAIALAHDLGHPPFGHAGEDALNECLALVKNKDAKSLTDKEKFNHNFRSYEIVTQFEKRYPHFNGLDLTHEVRVGILKHQTTYDVSSEVEDLKDEGPTLEARIVDIADALAYLSHDIDDGLTSGFITKRDFLESALWKDSYQRIETTLKVDDMEMLKYQLVKFLIDSQTKDLLEHSSKRLEEENFQSSDEVKQYHQSKNYEPVIDFSGKMKQERGVLQRLLHEKLYEHYRVQRMTGKAKRVIREIFEVYNDNPNQLSYDVWNRQPESQCDSIVNYIASMTDRFALDEHKKLFNPYQKV